MSIATEIAALNTNLTAAKNAVTAKGGTVGDTGLAGLATEIAGIPSGGGGYTPTVPEPPSSYATVKFLNIESYLEYYENIDPATVGAFVCFPKQDVFDDFKYLDPYAVPQEEDFFMDSVFFTSPNTGEMCNLIFRWNNSEQKFEFVFYDSSQQRHTFRQIEQWDLEMYGIVISDLSFTMYGNDYDLVNLRLSYRPYLMGGGYGDTHNITDSTFFNDIMTPETTMWFEYNDGAGFAGLVRNNDGTLLQKQFMTYINFGSLASSITTIGDYQFYHYDFLKEIYNFPESVTSIGDNFLQFCTSLNSYIKFTNVTTIGDYFMSYCTAFNQPIAFPNCTSVGTFFMANCLAFNSPISFGSSISVKTNFLSGMSNFNQDIVLPATMTLTGYNQYFNMMNMLENMTSKIDIGGLDASLLNATSTNVLTCYSRTSPAYATGITLVGDPTKVQAFMTRFPNRSAQPFRKLIDGSQS